MKVTTINKKGNKSLILFFNGWGMDERAISHIPSNDFDILMLNEYHDFTFDSSFVITYENIYIIAWSLGVWVANNWLQTCGIKAQTIAINGTYRPIDNKCGIDPQTFQKTIDNWNETSRTKFQLRMFKERNLFANNMNKLPIRTIGEQKQELAILQKNILDSNISDVKWDKVFVGSDDSIFTAENQTHFWNQKAHIINKTMPHYPFLELSNWEKIIE